MQKIMQAENWKKVKQILDEVLSLDVSERRRALQNSEISPEIRAEVESLLAFENESEDLMRLSAIEFSKDFFDDANQDTLIGQQIGAYRIIRELGQGGMGAVYLAERTDGKFEQKVALKLLKRELNTAALRRRFQQEREILASLEHPHIARLLDAGTTDDQIPFLAMEYVEGSSVDEYCDDRQLDLGQRLDLFRKVCSAAGFAHRNLIVHRDLKPSNILVGADGNPKLLDFGISKILSAEFEQTDSATVTKLGVMTPGYASPEQLQGKSVTTATDIYSLGVILYELLSGHRPFEAKENDLKEIYLAVLENEPERPSSVVSRPLKPGKNSTSENEKQKTKGETQHTNPKFLSGDLDNIVLKALRKEPERRYSSAENFAEDIHRHQRGLPVTARPNTFSYRAEKFFKRNRASVAAGIIIILALIGGIAATLWQSRVARAERVKAENRFNDVRTLANSFLFEFSPLIENLPGSTPARRLLVSRALEYLDNLSQEAGDDLKLQRELAKAYEKVGDVQGNPYNPNIGDSKGALQSYEKARIIQEKLLEKDSNNLIIQSDLANLYEFIGGLESNGGDYNKAKAFYDKSLGLREKLVGQEPQNYEAQTKLAKIVRSRGLIPFFEGDNKKALEYYNRAKEIYEKLKNEHSDDDNVAHDYAYTLVNIGEAYGWDGEYELAGENLQKGLEMLIILGEKYPNSQSFQRSLNLAYSKRGENYEDVKDHAKSVTSFSKALEIAQKALEADPQSFQSKRDVALGNKKLANALDSAGKNRESLEKLIIALEMFRQMSAADPGNTEHPYDIANIRFSIGETYLNLKNYESALETFQTAKAEFQKVLEVNPENMYAARMSSFNLNRIGKSYAKLAEKGNRQQLLPKAIENFRASLDNFYKLKTQGKLGDYDLEEIAALEKELEKFTDLTAK